MDNVVLPQYLEDGLILADEKYKNIYEIWPISSDQRVSFS